MYRKLCFVFLLIFNLHWASAHEHKYYVSVTQIQYNKALNVLEFSARLFIDDFELALQNHFDKDFKIDENTSKETLNKYVESYVNLRMKIKQNSEVLQLRLLGFEFEADQLVAYFEVPLQKAGKRWEISNEFLTEIYPDQRNFVHFKYENQRESSVLHLRKTSDIFKFS